MMRKNHGPVTMMGFARYEKRDDVETEELIEACLNWRRMFLDRQDGIVFHCFLGNLKGQFADAIMAVDQAAFEEMSKRHPEDKSSQTFMSLLKPDTIRLTPNAILKQGVEVPSDFSCIEFGTFRMTEASGFSQSMMLEISRKIEVEYLSKFSASRAHFMGKVDDETYSEITFVHTLGAAREICNGYLTNDVCGELLAMFDPKSADLDFWHVLA